MPLKSEVLNYESCFDIEKIASQIAVGEEQHAWILALLVRTGLFSTSMARAMSTLA